MASKHAVLGLVIERPDYGYGLYKRLADRCAPWAWSRPAVYAALEELSSAKLVSADESLYPAGSGGHARTIYSATPGGVSFFDEWMFGPSALEAPRRELELKLVMARPHELPRLVEMSLAQEQDCVERIAALAREARRAPGGSQHAWGEVAARLVRDTEVKQLRLRVEWLQEARSTMKLFLHQHGTAPVRPHVLGAGPHEPFPSLVHPPE
ncbi:MAG TPA: PadR family transcriptional regulator [Solirubrobacteraceae bacterium]|nr:PadR family transcriptional regulator [Solirubrobacteraceae bacterium]